MKLKLSVSGLDVSGVKLDDFNLEVDYTESEFIGVMKAYAELIPTIIAGIAGAMPEVPFPEPNYAEAEREHFGDADKRTGIYAEATCSPGA